MYRDSYEYKRYKEEYDAYQDEKEELIKELEKEEKIEMKNTNTKDIDECKKCKESLHDCKLYFYIVFILISIIIHFYIIFNADSVA